MKKRFTIYKSDKMILAHIPNELWESSNVVSPIIQDEDKPIIITSTINSGYVIFTDGGCIDNGGKNPSASWSFVVFNNGSELYKNFAKVVQGQYGQELPSNNRAEWTAILRALEYIEFKDIKADITIYTDSMLAVNTINKWYASWVAKNIVNKKANPVLITEVMNLYHKLSVGHSIKVKHCKAHQSEPDKSSPDWFIWKGNDICDKLCTALLPL